MGKPTVFLSSTYLDLRDVRDVVGSHIQQRGFEVTMFERGGVFYDPTQPLDQSCYREVKNANLFVLLVGGRYGSPASDGGRRGREYASVTRRELETAVAHGIPVLTFVRKEVQADLRTYLATKKSIRERVSYGSVDDTQVFRMLEQILQQRKNNPIFPYTVPRDIVDQLEHQFTGLLRKALDDHRGTAATAKTTINGFKLFYYRHQAGLSFQQLGDKSGLSRRLLQRLEAVPLRSDMQLGEHLFQSTSREALEKLETALDCPNTLASGADDDFLSLYIHYYGTYKRRLPRAVRQRSGQLAMFPTRVLVLDFDGTMTLRRDSDLTTWERLWVALGYSVNDCAAYARQYFTGAISHSEWCDVTAKHFRARQLRPGHLEEVASTLSLVPGILETLEPLNRAGVSLFLVSGSIRAVIRSALGDDIYNLFDEVYANDLIFDGSGRLKEIRGTQYDFEGKADFIRTVIDRQDVSPLEVLFVGNSLNDVWASNAGARTLCVNPHFTNPNDVQDWTYCIRSMTHFGEILRYVGDVDVGVPHK